MAKKITYDSKTGEESVVEMTPDEVAAIIANNRPVWHLDDKPVQVIIPDTVKSDLLLKKQEHNILGNHPDVAMLLEYVKTISVSSVNEDGSLYIYLSEIYPEHKAFLESFGIQINTKANG